MLAEADDCGRPSALDANLELAQHVADLQSFLQVPLLYPEGQMKDLVVGNGSIM